MYKQKKFILFFFIFSIFIQSYTSHSQSIIYWENNYPIRWADFQKKPPARHSKAAITATGVEFSYKLQENILEVKIFACFYPKLSWVNRPSEYLLKHEQGHFDITEIYARELKESIIKEKFNKKNFKSKLDKIYDKNQVKYSQFQNQYDKDTHFGQNKESQERWNKMIVDRLNKLEKHNSSTIIRIKLR